MDAAAKLALHMRSDRHGALVFISMCQLLCQVQCAGRIQTTNPYYELWAHWFCWVCAGDAVLSERLKLIGSCRNAGDSARVDALRQLAQVLPIQDYVDFHVNAPWDEVL